jgi:hypothetical protein
LRPFTINYIYFTFRPYTNIDVCLNAFICLQAYRIINFNIVNLFRYILNLLIVLEYIYLLTSLLHCRYSLLKYVMKLITVLECFICLHELHLVNFNILNLLKHVLNFLIALICFYLLIASSILRRNSYLISLISLI